MGSGGRQRMTGTPLPMDALTRAVNAIPDDQLSAVRQDALATFANRGFPTVRDEDWKYTDLSEAVRISCDWLEADTSSLCVNTDPIDAIRESIDAHWLVVSNGEMLDDAATLKSVTGLEIAALEPGEIRFDEPLSDLNAALLGRGLRLRISPDYADDKPIGILIADEAEAAPTASQVRIHIEVDAGCKARVVEYHTSVGLSAHYSNVFMQLSLARAAACDYVRIQERDLAHSQTARLNVSMAADSRLQHAAMDLGGKLARNDLHVDLKGQGASARFDGLYIAGPGQLIDNHTRVDHRVGPATSAQEYRGILAGRCRAVWNGKAVVHQGADGTDATQSNHNLLLTEDAEIDAKPELEIYADEVKCAHGTTVGQLDEKALYYLRTRGISRERASRILTRAFAATIVGRSPLAELHELLGEKVENRLRDIAAGSAS
jgi:Fe-S cluster assembly protein SufD